MQERQQLSLVSSFVQQDYCCRLSRFECLGWKPSRMPPKCSQAKPVVRTWSIQFPWLDRPDFYRSGGPRQRSRLISRAPSKKGLCIC